MTRARQKAQVSAHQPKRGSDYYLHHLLEGMKVGGADPQAQALGQPGQPIVVKPPCALPGQNEHGAACDVELSITVWITPPETVRWPTSAPTATAEVDWSALRLPLFDPAGMNAGATASIAPAASDEEPQDAEPARLPRPPAQAYFASDRYPGRAVGDLVHRAVERECFPVNPGFEGLLAAAALELELSGPSGQAALVRVRQLLSRLHESAFWGWVLASQRWHELPYSVPLAGGGADQRILDLLVRNEHG